MCHTLNTSHHKAEFTSVSTRQIAFSRDRLTAMRDCPTPLSPWPVQIASDFAFHRSRNLPTSHGHSYDRLGIAILHSADSASAAFNSSRFIPPPDGPQPASGSAPLC